MISSKVSANHSMPGVGLEDADDFRDRYPTRSSGPFGRAWWRAQYAVESRVQGNHTDRE